MCNGQYFVQHGLNKNLIVSSTPNPPRTSHNLLQSQPECTKVTQAWQGSHSKFDFYL